MAVAKSQLRPNFSFSIRRRFSTHSFSVSEMTPSKSQMISFLLMVESPFKKIEPVRKPLRALSDTLRYKC